MISIRLLLLWYIVQAIEPFTLRESVSLLKRKTLKAVFFGMKKRIN